MSKKIAGLVRLTIVGVSTALSVNAVMAQDAKESRTPVLAVESVALSRHELSVGGHTLHYTAAAGNLMIKQEAKEESGKPDGKESKEEGEQPYHSLFYVAYTVDGVEAKSRPVTFLYNGGPGSSSLWLHMGSVGPVRVVTQSPEATRPAPFEVVPNQYTLLDKTDLVFIDAPGTGFSHPVGKGTIKDVAGVDEDIRAFDKFIVRYITANQRWNSPKFLFGESYGTTRSAALAAALQEDGVELNGVVLLSSILNYNRRSAGLDNDYIGTLPSFAAIAYYYKKAGQSAGSLPAFVEQARRFAATEYAEALAKGNALTPAEFDAAAAKVSAFTGLSVEYVKAANLRINASRFRKELLRGDAEILGRYDARFAGPDFDSAGETPGYDPSDTGISGAFVGAFHDYLQRELKYKGQDTYYVSGPNLNQNWDWKHRSAGGGGPGGREQAMPYVAGDLGDTMRKNPHLKVFSANGWFDLATPFFSTEYDLSHMGTSGKLRENVEFGYYPAGHMVYLNVDALKDMRRDLEKFYSSAVK